MAIPQYDAAGDLLAWKLEHTAQEVDDTIDHALTDTAYDPTGSIAQAGGIAAYIDSLDGEEELF